MNAEETVYSVLTKPTGKMGVEMRRETDLASGLGIDSPVVPQHPFQLEETLEIEISDEEAAAMQTVGERLNFVI